MLRQVGERVTRITVPRESLDAVRDQRPADRRRDRDEQLRIVDPRRCLDEQRIALRRDRGLARGIGEPIDLRVADRHHAATEPAHEPGRRGGRRDFVDERKIGICRIRRALDRQADHTPVAHELLEQEVAAGPIGERDADDRLVLPEQAIGLDSQLGEAIAQRCAEPGWRRYGRHAVEAGLQQCRPRGQSWNSNGADVIGAVEHLGEQVTHFGIVDRAAGVSRDKSEQA